MLYFVIRRFFWAIWLFLVATIITYIIFFVIPSDPATIACGTHCTPQIIAHVRHSLHLDIPIYQQYWIFLWNIVRHASLGYSFYDGTSVRWILGQDSRVTGSLVFGGLFFWLLISVPIGILSALKPRSLLDRAGTVFVLVGISAPTVWFGLMLAYTFGYKLGWTPIADYCNFFPNSSGTCGGPARWAYHLLLPWVTFTFLFAAIYVRMIRSTVMETVNEDYVRTAWAKGASRRRVVIHHILRNSLLPVVTMLGMDIGVALGGSVFIENVFTLHGLGQELVIATHRDDVPVVVGIVVFVSLAVIAANFLIDLTYTWLDPRVRMR